ncbi:MAG TPA: hypothetical protein PKH65_03870 [Bacteroidia bacterium]|nr:hypothetical protein [Bacteroidia bacterium]HNT79796.1 hypothetical protein [Bacteroidia bacterium]
MKRKLSMRKATTQKQTHKVRLVVAGSSILGLIIAITIYINVSQVETSKANVESFVIMDVSATQVDFNVPSLNIRNQSPALRGSGMNNVRTIRAEESNETFQTEEQ